MIEWEYDDVQNKKYPIALCDFCEEQEKEFYEYEGHYYCLHCLIETLVTDDVIDSLTDEEVCEKECENDA